MWWVLGTTIVCGIIGGLLITKMKSHFSRSTKVIEAAALVGLVPNFFKMFLRNPFIMFILVPIFVLTGAAYVSVVMIFLLNPVTTWKEIITSKETAAKNFMTVIENPLVTENMVTKEDVEEFGKYYNMDSQEIEQLYLEVRTHFRNVRPKES